MSDRLEVYIYWVCPHCGFKNRLTTDIVSQYRPSTVIVSCDQEDGGCDNEVAVSVKATISAQVYLLTPAEVQP